MGCYQNSKQYLGADKSKTYCQCTVNKLSEKFSDDELDRVFKQKPKDIVKNNEFASKFFEKKSLIKVIQKLKIQSKRASLFSENQIIIYMR